MAGIAELAQHREAIHAGHHHVEQHRIEPARDELVEAGVARARVHDRDALRIEVSVEELREASIVVDEEYAHGLLSHTR